MIDKVIAIVVTYNRKLLLIECLEALLSQSYSIDKIIVINNCSTDGTEELFNKGEKFGIPQIEFITTEKNLGGAGGFQRGIQIADSCECDWVWIMDDDTIPEKNALDGLLSAKNKLLLRGIDRISYLASLVYGPNNEPMNVPVVQLKPTKNGYSDWYQYLDDKMVKIKSATFVSILVNHNAIKALGYPIAEYFIWGDDTEYTQRLSNNYGDAFLCGDSKVLHKRYNAKSISIFNEDNPDRISMYYYYYRNSLLNAKKYNSKGNSFLHMCQYFVQSIGILFNKNSDNRFKKFCAINKGIIHYLFKSRGLK